MGRYKYVGEEAGKTYIQGSRGAGYTVNLNLAAKTEKRPIYDKNEKLRGYVCHNDIRKSANSSLTILHSIP